MTKLLLDANANIALESRFGVDQFAFVGLHPVVFLWEDS